MNLEEMRKRLGEIVALLTTFQAAETLSAEQVEEVGTVTAEYETLTSQIEAKEKMEAITAAATKSTRKVAPAVTAVTASVGKNRVENDPKRGFENSADFYASVIGQAKGQDDKRFIQAALMEKFGENGGIMVPEEFRATLLSKIDGEESLLPLTNQFVTSSNTLTLPVYETAPWDSTAGLQAYWDGELQKHKESDAVFSDVSLRLHKLAVMVKVSEELMEDAPLLQSWINNQAPGAIVQKINTAILKGTGVGQPLGLMNSGFKVVVAPEAGQAADSLVYENLNKMLGALTPASIPRARWIVNPAILPQLRNITFGSAGANPVPAYLPSTGVSGAPYGTLYGIPIMPMMGSVSKVGDVGDIMLVDFSYYMTAVKSSGIKSAMSTHVFFDQDAVALKFTQRIAGQVPYKSPITNEAGDFTAAGIVMLGAR